MSIGSRYQPLRYVFILLTHHRFASVSFSFRWIVMRANNRSVRLIERIDSTKFIESEIDICLGFELCVLFFSWENETENSMTVQKWVANVWPSTNSSIGFRWIFPLACNFHSASTISMRRSHHYHQKPFNTVVFLWLSECFFLCLIFSLSFCSFRPRFGFLKWQNEEHSEKHDLNTIISRLIHVVIVHISFLRLGNYIKALRNSYAFNLAVNKTNRSRQLVQESTVSCRRRQSMKRTTKGMCSLEKK